MRLSVDQAACHFPLSILSALNITSSLFALTKPTLSNILHTYPELVVHTARITVGETDITEEEQETRKLNRNLVVAHSAMYFVFNSDHVKLHNRLNSD